MSEHLTAGADRLNNVVKFIRRFVVLSDDQATAVALWTAHSHAFEAADTTPYLAITSAEKRSGKTRLLEVLELLVREPLPTANISDAALFRAIAELAPTLLLDEVDAIFGNKARDREDLRGLLNAGYRRGAVAHRMGGTRMTTLEAFPVFCAKVFALIGDLPDTISDRAVRIRLLRRTREEPIERFRRRDVAAEAEEVRDTLADWCEPQVDELRTIRPSLPEALDDRAQDCWESLLALAQLAGADWPERAWQAAIALSGPGARQEEDASLSARLLADIHQVFSADETKRYRTADLIEKLSHIEESPWGDYYGKPISPHGLSKLLRPFGIRTMPVHTHEGTVKGYKAEQFADAFHRHLGVREVREVRTGSENQIELTEPNLLTPDEKQGVSGDPAQEAASNPSNPSNPQTAGNGNGHLSDDELTALGTARLDQLPAFAGEAA